MNEDELVFVNNTVTTLHVLYSSEKTIYRVFTGLFLVVGASFNFYFIFMYYWYRIRRTHFNYCLMHLSVSSVIQHLGFIPYISLDVQDFSSKGAVSKHILCALKDGLTLFFAGAFSTAFISSYITIVRYKLIKSPLYRFQLKKWKTFRFIILVWCTSVVIMMPNFFTLHSKENLPVCVRRYPNGSLLLRLYGALTTMIGVGAPFVILVVTYILTIKQLYCTRGSDFRRRANNKPRNSKKILRLFGVFLISMAFSWLPFVYVWVKNALGHFGKSNAEEVRKAHVYRFTILPSLASGMMIVVSGSLKCCRQGISRNNIIKRNEDTLNTNSVKIFVL